MTTIKMSAGEVEVMEREVFTHWEAIDLFKAFFADENFPNHISERTQPLTALEFVDALCILKVFHRFRVGL